MAQILPILMYHQIDASPPPGTPMRGMSVTPASFARQMGLLRLLGYRGVSLSELEPSLRGEHTDKLVGITFDDGYCNNIEHALPVLQRHGFSATCYAVSQPHGGRNAWDEAMGVPQKPLMSPSDMRAWVAGGMEIGSHTRHHVNLTQVDTATAQEEIAGSKQDLEDITGQAVRHFCYPYGQFRPEHRQMVLEAGYSTATTVQRGRVHPGDDLLQLPRVLVAHSTHLLQFWAKTWHRYEDRYR